MLLFKKRSARRKIREFLEKTAGLKGVDGTEYLMEKVGEKDKDVPEQVSEFLQQELNNKKFLVVFFGSETNDAYLVCEGVWHYFYVCPRDKSCRLFSESWINQRALEERLLAEIFEGGMISAEIMIQRLRIIIWPQTGGQGIDF